MAISVKFFASLRERLGRAEAVVESAEAISVAEVWKRATGGAPFVSNTLVAVNMDYADTSRLVREGDEVAFFPPITGGAYDG
jgi:sulfur-carrier protein